MGMKTKEKSSIPADAVLLIPEPEVGEKPTCAVKPGYYNPKRMLALIDQHKDNPDTIQFIGDMLETGDPENDGFANTLRAARSNAGEIAKIIEACRES